MKINLIFTLGFMVGCGIGPGSDAPYSLSEKTIKVSGQVLNLVNSSLKLRLNSSEVIAITSPQNSFEFTTKLSKGQTYSVTVQNHPSSPVLYCLVSNGSGSVSENDVSNINVQCPQVQSLSIGANSFSIPASSSIQLSATGFYSGSISKNLSSLVTWASDNESIATITSSGLLRSLASGSVNITASFAGVSKTQSFTFTSATLSSIQITPSNNQIPVSTSKQIIATGIYSDGTRVDLSNAVSWTSSNSAVVQIDSVGKISGVSAGSATVTATLGAVSANTTVSISAATLNSIDVSPGFINGAPGGTQQLIVIGNYSDGSSLDITSLSTYTASDISIASESGGGLISFNSSGSSSILVGYLGLSVLVPVQVSGKTLSGITVTPSSFDIPIDVTKQFIATANYSDGSTSDITNQAEWGTADPTVINVQNTVGTKGKVRSLAIGTAALTVSYSNFSTQATINVVNLSLSSLRASPGGLLIPKGVNIKFLGFATFSNAIEYEITDTATWTSSNTSVATVSNSLDCAGCVTNLYAGTSYVSANIVLSFGGQSLSSVLNINPGSITQVIIAPNDLSLNVFKTQSFRAFGVFSDAGLADITSLVSWLSSSSAVATISNSTFSKGVLSTLSEGNSIVSAQIGAASGSRNITVSNSGPESLILDGIGLKTEWYSSGGTFNQNTILNSNFYIGSRINSTLNFDLAMGTAPLGVGDNFGIRATGFVKAKTSENYTFCTDSDDGIRVWVDGNLVINNWTAHAVATNCSSPIALVADQKYAIKVEFFEQGGHAVLKLKWQTGTISREVIPQANLFDQ